MEKIEKILAFLNGSGYGSGDGYGSGYGSGYGYGSGDGYGLKIKKINNEVVFYIDSVPTIIDKIRENFAKARIVNINDFSCKNCFLAKVNGCFAHETTLKKAERSARQKFYAKLDIGKRIKEFCSTFKKDKKYDAQNFFIWHNILTGSCEAGRTNFIKSNNVDMNRKYSVLEFIKICENSYGCDVIKQLKEFYI